MVFQSVKMRSTRSQAMRPSGDDALRELFTEVEKGAVKSKRVSRVAGPSEIVVGEPCVVSSSVVTPRDGPLDLSLSPDEYQQRYPWDDHPVTGTCSRKEDFSFGSICYEWVRPEGPDDFFRCSWERGTPVTPSMLLTVGRSCRGFHQDLDPPYDQINTVVGGRKLWLFTPPRSRVTTRVIRGGWASTVWEVLGCLKDHKESHLISYGVQSAGESVYVPWGWGHAVVTDTDDKCCLQIVEFACQQSELDSRYSRLRDHASVGVRRGDVVGATSL